MRTLFIVSLLALVGQAVVAPTAVLIYISVQVTLYLGIVLYFKVKGHEE